MKYKLFVSDYDGTLGLAPKNGIDEQTLKAINTFTEKGGIFVVCSGRETTSITRILRQCDLKGVVVSFQGARITDIQSGKSIFEGGLSAEKAIEAINLFKQNGLSPIAYGEDNFYIEEYSPIVEIYERATGLKGEIADVIEVINSQKENVSKVCAFGDDGLVNQVADKLNAIYKGKDIIFNSGATCLIEAINPDNGKGNAVRYLSRLYGIPFEQIITVGDSTNDIELVKGPWHGVAVGDGREELKKVADEVTVPFSEQPVKTLLEKYCLND